LSSPYGKGLAKSALIVMFSIVLSRITGFLRAMLIPNKLGIGEISDAYNIAFLLPDLMYNMLVGGAIAASLIPVLSAYIGERKEDDGWKAAGTFINISLILMIILCSFGIIFTPQLIGILASGHVKRQTIDVVLAVKLTRILFPSVTFLMLAGFLNGILNSYQKFVASAFGPAIYNIFSSLSIYIFGDKSEGGVQKVVYGILCSSVLYFLFQLLLSVKNLKNYKFKFYFKHPGVVKLFKLAIPSLISSSIAQINLIVSNKYTTSFAVGSVTALSMANTIWQFPYGVFAQGMGIAILPTLSIDAASKNSTKFRNTFTRALNTVLLLSIPSSIGLIVLRYPIIRAVFKWSINYNENSTIVSGNILMFFSIALITQSFIAVVNRGFYANNDTKTPLYIGASSIIVNAVLSYLFTHYLNQFVSVAGIALAFSIASTVNVLLLSYFFNKKIEGINIHRTLLFIAKIAFASIIMGIVLYVINAKLSNSMLPKLIQLLYLSIEIIIGVIVYFSITFIMKIEEMVYIFNIIIKKMRSKS